MYPVDTQDSRNESLVLAAPADPQGDPRGHPLCLLPETMTSSEIKDNIGQTYMTYFIRCFDNCRHTSLWHQFSEIILCRFIGSHTDASLSMRRFLFCSTLSIHSAWFLAFMMKVSTAWWLPGDHIDPKLSITAPFDSNGSERPPPVSSNGDHSVTYKSMHPFGTACSGFLQIGWMAFLKFSIIRTHFSTFCLINR